MSSLPLDHETIRTCVHVVVGLSVFCYCIHGMTSRSVATPAQPQVLNDRPSSSAVETPVNSQVSQSASTTTESTAQSSSQALTRSSVGISVSELEVISSSNPAASSIITQATAVIQDNPKPPSVHYRFPQYTFRDDSNVAYMTWLRTRCHEHAEARYNEVHRYLSNIPADKFHLPNLRNHVKDAINHLTLPSLEDFCRYGLGEQPVKQVLIKLTSAMEQLLITRNDIPHAPKSSLVKQDHISKRELEGSSMPNSKKPRKSNTYATQR